MPKCFKKITALFLAGVIALSFAACSSGGESEEDTTVSTQPADTPKSDTPLRISYTKSDSLNPYKAETQNNIVIADLVFDTLFRLDETFSPILELAGSYEFTDATTLNVTYRSGAVFSDGSALQSGDILASYEAAKDSPIYSGTLSGIRSASAGAGSTIVFELAYANPNAASLLTFPILKASEIDSDLPLGSGRYAFDEDDSGNITLEYMDMDLRELVQQTEGELAEKFAARRLTMVLNIPEEPAVIHVDGRRMWRVLENVFGNAAKYAMPGTRVYADIILTENQVCFSLKNVSEQQLNISADELTERFIRGDISRTTEGSGLGLSIAKSLTTMQGGEFELYLDGDLFRVNICFPRVRSKAV